MLGHAYLGVGDFDLAFFRVLFEVTDSFPGVEDGLSVMKPN